MAAQNRKTNTTGLVINFRQQKHPKAWNLRGGPSNVGGRAATVAEQTRSSLAWKSSENRSALSSSELDYHIKIINLYAMLLTTISLLLLCCGDGLQEPEDWSRCWMVNDYKSKNDALTCGLYRDIMLLEYAKKKNLLMALVGLEREQSIGYFRSWFGWDIWMLCM